MVLQVPLLAELPPHLVGAVLAEATVLRFGRGDIIFHQGEEPRFLHILLDGQIGLAGAVSDGEETVVDILKTGDVFVPAAVLTARPYLVGATALAPSRLLALPADRLRRDLREMPDLAVVLLTALAKYFRHLVREVKDLKLKSASQRLALYLVKLSPKREGPAVIKLPHNKALIAARVGIRPETMSRALAGLRDYGVQAAGSQISIADLARLAAYCHDGEEAV